MTVEYMIVGGDHHGKVYSALDGITSFIPKDGPPLPFILEFNEKKGDKLDQLKRVLKRLRALETEFNVIGHERLVRAAVQQLAPLSSTLWPHRDKVYALLDSRKARRVISMGYGTVEPYLGKETANPYFVMFTFPTVVHAIVWILARGNHNLKEWDLDVWMGKARQSFRREDISRKAATPQPLRTVVISDDDDSDSEQQGPPLTPPTNKFLFIPSISAPFPRAYSASPRRNPPASTRTPSKLDRREETPPPSSPSKSIARVTQSVHAAHPLVSPAIFKHLQSEDAVFTVKGTWDDPHVVMVSDVDEVERYQHSRTCIDRKLPADVRFYLKCHGWTSERMLSTIEAAYALNTKHNEFVALLTDASMPMTQAEYLVTLMYCSGEA